VAYGYVYLTTNLVNGRVYVGQRIGNFNFEYLGSGVCLQRAIRKYGKNKFVVKFVKCAGDKAGLDFLEIKYIAQYRKRLGKENVYNVLNGGDGGGEGGPFFKGHNHSEETKKKMSIARRGRVCSEETKAKIGKAKFGVPRPKSVCEKLSNLLKGKTFIARFGEQRAKEIIEKSACKQRGQKRPKQSVAMKGRFVGDKNPMYGKHRSEEFKQQKRLYFLSDRNPGKNKTPETIKKLSDRAKEVWKERKNAEQ